jgi:hypothetical protein
MTRMWLQAVNSGAEGGGAMASATREAQYNEGPKRGG